VREKVCYDSHIGLESLIDLEKTAVSVLIVRLDAPLDTGQPVEKGIVMTDQQANTFKTRQSVDNDISSD